MPRAWAVGAAIVLAAIVFGLDHLPLLFQSISDVPMNVVLRIVVLNTAAGLAFGMAPTSACSRRHLVRS